MQIAFQSSLRGLLKGPAEFERAQTMALYYGALFAQREMVKRVPVNTGMLRASIQVGQPVNSPIENAKIVKIGPSGGPSLYAYFVENGRKPGKMPPFEPIAYWVTRKLRIAPGTEEWMNAVQAIRWKIAMKGTKGAEFVKKTVEIDGKRIQELMTTAFNRAAGL